MSDNKSSTESLEAIRKTIRTEVAEDTPAIRAKYLEHFGPQVEEFCDAMTAAYIAWRKLDAQSKDKESAYVSALVFAAINSTAVSMRLLINGHQSAAGAIQRQALETVALAVLCTSRSLGIMSRFMKGTYSTNKAIRDLLRNTAQLELSDVGVRALADSRDFFNAFSHPSRLSLATLTSFSGEGLYLGSAFDSGKLAAYRKEISTRVSLASLLSNIIVGIQDGRRAERTP